MKTYVILLLFAISLPLVAQQQTSTLPPMQLWESVAYKTSTIDDEIALGKTPVDTLDNTDTLKLSINLIGRGDKVKFTARFANSTDSFKVQQYDLNGDVWVTAPITYKKRNAALANGSSWQIPAGADTTAENGWVSPVGTNLNVGLTLDYTIPNRTNGDVRILRAVQDTGTVKITYVLEGKL